MAHIETAPLILPPHCCAVTGREDGEMVDFETDVLCTEPPHLYIKRDVLEATAREVLGMASIEEVEALRAEVQALGDQIADVAEAAQLADDLDAALTRERTAHAHPSVH